MINGYLNETVKFSYQRTYPYRTAQLRFFSSGTLTFSTSQYFEQLLPFYYFFEFRYDDKDTKSSPDKMAESAEPVE